jgi:hypothetical protein
MVNKREKERTVLSIKPSFSQRRPPGKINKSFPRVLTGTLWQIQSLPFRLNLQA